MAFTTGVTPVVVVVVGVPLAAGGLQHSPFPVLFTLYSLAFFCENHILIAVQGCRQAA